MTAAHHLETSSTPAVLVMVLPTAKDVALLTEAVLEQSSNSWVYWRASDVHVELENKQDSTEINSLAPGGCSCNLKLVIF